MKNRRHFKMVRFIPMMLLLASSVWAQSLPSNTTVQDAKQVCKLKAYVIDPDPKGLNVRTRPDPKSPSIAVIPRDPDGTIVEIQGSDGLWLLISKAETIGKKQVFTGKGWVYAPMLGTETRAKAKLYLEPDIKSHPVSTVDQEQEVIMQSCQGNWAKVKFKNYLGWLGSAYNCPNPVTTCP
jgi:SH3 domain-containing protein